MAKPIGNQVANMKNNDKTSRRVKGKFEPLPGPVVTPAAGAVKKPIVKIKIRKK